MSNPYGRATHSLLSREPCFNQELCLSTIQQKKKCKKSKKNVTPSVKCVKNVYPNGKKAKHWRKTIAILAKKLAELLPHFFLEQWL